MPCSPPLRSPRSPRKPSRMATRRIPSAKRATRLLPTTPALRPRSLERLSGPTRASSLRRAQPWSAGERSRPPPSSCWCSPALAARPRRARRPMAPWQAADERRGGSRPRRRSRAARTLFAPRQARRDTAPGERAPQRRVAQARLCQLLADDLGHRAVIALFAVLLVLAAANRVVFWPACADRGDQPRLLPCRGRCCSSSASVSYRHCGACRGLEFAAARQLRRAVVHPCACSQSLSSCRSWPLGG